MQPSTALPASPAPKPPLLISRDYALLWSGQAISLMGDAVFATTIVLWIALRVGHDLSWAPLAVGAAFLAREVPEFIVGPLAGVYVDRWDKRRTMQAMDLARAALLALLIVAGGRNTLALAPFITPRGVLLSAIYATLALLTAASFFFLPARLALIGDVVPDPLRERASGLAQSSAAVAGVLGPSLAAPLFLAVGAGWALGLDAISFLVSFAAISLVSPPSPTSSVASERENVLAELAEGAGLVLSHAVLRALLTAGMLISVGLGAFETLGVFFLRQNLHAPATLFGLLAGAQGLGTLAGAVIGGPLTERIGAARLLWCLAALMGLLFVLFSRLTSLAPALVVLFCAGAAFGVLEVAETPLLLRAAPRTHVGRVVALLVPMYGLASALSALAAGSLASLLRGLHLSLLWISIGPVDGILAIGGLFMVLGGLSARGAIDTAPPSTDAPSTG